MGEIIVRPTPLVAMPFTGERLTSEYGGQTQIEHLHRYLLAREWCRDRDVLDVASGEGYGTALLAQVASSATGVELAQEAVDHATSSYVAENLRYLAGDARKLPLPNASFDVVVSFETIEHFAEQKDFLSEVERVLRPGGMLIVSTPDRDNYSPAETSANPFHVYEMTPTEFCGLLQRHFSDVSLLLQRPIYGSILMPPTGSNAMPLSFERRGDLHFEGSSGLARPQYMLAFASNHPVPALPPSVYIDTSRLGLLNPPDAEARFTATQAALATAQTEASRVAAELVQTTDNLNEERVQNEIYGVAARERATEIEQLRRQLAECREQNKQIEAYASAEQDRMQEVEALRFEAAGLRGELQGLLVANTMAENACTIMRSRVDEAIRQASAADAATSRVQAARQESVRVLEAELAKTQLAVQSATAYARALESSTSWRVTALLRVLSRAFLRRS